MEVLRRHRPEVLPMRAALHARRSPKSTDELRQHSLREVGPQLGAVELGAVGYPGAGE